MVSIYYLSGFNNYYNRTILLPQSTSLADYTDYLLKIDEVENFNPNDNVMTELTVNYWGTDEDISDLLNIDYVLISSDNRTIDSKWFALDRKRIRGQQWQFTLRRDLVSDNYNAVINAPCFIEKATLPANSPLLWNKEDMTFNQIKQEEVLLKDGSGCPWIIGYYAKNASEDYLHGVVDANDLDAMYDEVITNSFDSWAYNATITPFLGTPTFNYRIYCKSIHFDIGTAGIPAYYSYSNTGEYLGHSTRSANSSGLSVSNFGGYSAGYGLQDDFQDNIDTLFTYATSYLTKYNDDTAVRAFNSYNGKIIKDSEGKFYLISIYQSGTKEETIDIKAGSLYTALSTFVENSAYFDGTPNGSSFKITVSRPEYMMIATELKGQECTWDLRGEKIITDDAPYNIFAIPFGNTTLYNGEYAVATSNEVISMATANSIIRTMGDNLYDIQLLPYCPINATMSNGNLVLYDLGSFRQVKAPGDNILANFVCYILNVPKAKFSKNLNYTIEIPASSVEKKVMNETEMYRLCSPNYNGAFEFSPAKNDGVDYFNVDCEYKPFQPYIHINPNFKGMYGSDFNDARGLICNGDFSLAQIKDAWQNYQIQNKNFQEIFSRQIENMELTNSIQKTQDVVQAIAGGVSSVTSGVGSGMLVGGSRGPITAGIFGGAGAVAGIMGGIADVNLNEKLRADALDMTKDQFTYNLGNIQALPYTLTKVSAYNNNNKLFPFLEKYSATEKEKQAFRDKLTYDGMTTMIIGTLAEYKQATPSYIKGRLIRLLNNPTLDYHGLTELANEIYKGVFI